MSIVDFTFDFVGIGMMNFPKTCDHGGKILMSGSSLYGIFNDERATLKTIIDQF
jgi:hypothetical protein